MVFLVIYIVVALLTFANLCAELWRDLMMFQQNSYRSDRYARWLRESGDTTSGWRLSGIIVLMFALTPFCPPNPGVYLAGIFSVLSVISLLRRRYKKPLVMTARALRIYVTSLIIGILVALACALLFGSMWLLAIHAVVLAWLACYCMSHVVLLMANVLLTPLENAITRRYYRDAQRILASMPDLKIIGVTGSYGKTTTKHYLQRILSEKYDTLMTPGSYNTTLGVVRTIREYLKPYHEVFVVEMGAKAVGDIKEICDLVHPDAGIITAVGPQHLESFKTIGAVQATKFELADAVPDGGFVVVNNDFEKIADRPVGNTRCIRYAVKNTSSGVDYVAEDIVYAPAGTSFSVRRTADSSVLKLFTRLVGECNISNILAAVAVARELGVDDARIAYAVERLEQVEHRLSIKRVPGGLTIIDDAFNSNPVGSSMALDVLKAMTSGKRILITPGMIELGESQYELNMDFGRKAAEAADVVIVVGHYNRDAIVEGLTDGGLPEDAMFTAESFAHAQNILQAMAAPGDIVLYENDLPDTFK